MFSDVLALVTAGGDLTEAMQQVFARQLGARLPAITHEEIRGQLWTRSRGLLILVVDRVDTIERTLRLAQEAVLQDLMVQLVVVHPAEIPDEAFACLDALRPRRLRWPTASAVLLGLIRPRLPRSAAPEACNGHAIHERVLRAVLNSTPSLRDMVEPLALAAAHDVPVLISGETGTGKTYLARLLHECSPRKGNRFQVVSCGALSPHLIESELFGHVKGAFTGAEQAKEGKFAAAGQGTLLLDEIDTLSLEQQANLLRVIETGEFEPVGSNQTHLCQARIIAASNWDIEAAMECGKFRRDLYYRLHVMAFHLPPLRERRMDIAPLVRGIVARYNTKFRKDLLEISPDVLSALESFSWPGNIRQLENVVQQAVLVSSGPMLLPSFLPHAIQRPAGNGCGNETTNSLVHNRQDVERTLIQRALLNADNSRTVAAKTLGISRVTLYKKMRKYGMLGQSAQGATV
ncbi:MAG TPA: sigma 54-interacting transcriptional regulator [Gemmataceae bacterium]|nr:sigma 54-interacting transcriptional regulator [Gemmataceae bacterium]